LKNIHLPFDRLTALSAAEGLRCVCHSFLGRSKKYASFLMPAHVLHLTLFEQPLKSTLKGVVPERFMFSSLRRE